MGDQSIYFEGKRLIGDDYTLPQIEKWYEEEKEGYANLGAKNRENYEYGYHSLNEIHAFNYLPKNKKFNNVLGLGSAYGDEFEPYIDRINNITIIEPSDNLVAVDIKGIKPTYVKPTIDGKINLPDNHFDLIVCLGTLHHIPNVSFVLSELLRVLQPNGYMILREPIISMGNWNESRIGLTKRERGIPVNIFRQNFQKDGIRIVQESFCLCMSSFLQRNLGKYFSKPIYSYKTYVKFDKLLSKTFAWNYTYHAKKFFQRIAPTSIFYTVTKDN